jgi:hypothetical protein
MSNPDSPPGRIKNAACLMELLGRIDPTTGADEALMVIVP